jgi:hypothetical protein
MKGRIVRWFLIGFGIAFVGSVIGWIVAAMRRNQDGPGWEAGAEMSVASEQPEPQSVP